MFARAGDSIRLPGELRGKLFAAFSFGIDGCPQALGDLNRAVTLNLGSSTDERSHGQNRPPVSKPDWQFRNTPIAGECQQIYRRIQSINPDGIGIC